MHALLAKFYHLGLMPFWRPPVAAFALAVLLRLLAPRRAGLAAALAVLAGWLALILPASVLPALPLARLAGLGVLLVLFPLAAPRAGRFALPLLALVAAWWIRGAPVTAPGVAGVVPVFLLLLAGLALARRLARGDTGWATIGAALALAAAVKLAGGALHWGYAAIVPACAGLALAGLPEAAAMLQIAIVLVAACAVVASDRGRFIPVDAAAAVPLLVWFLAPRLRRAGPILAGGLAAVGGVAVLYGATLLFALR